MNIKPKIQSYKWSILFFILPVFCKPQQRTITLMGANTWSVPVPTLTEAGTNYTSTYTSPENFILINGTIPGQVLLSVGSRISVSHTNSNWNTNLSLSVRRTGSGNACSSCSIEGNLTTTIVPVTTTSQSFIILRSVGILGILLAPGGTYQNIPVQIGISGISVTLPEASYSTSIVFTISDV